MGPAGHWAGLLASVEIVFLALILGSCLSAEADFQRSSLSLCVGNATDN